MLIPLMRAEVFKLMRRAMPRVLLLILVVGVALLYFFLIVAIRSSPEGTSQQDLDELRDSIRVENVRDSGLGLVQFMGTVVVIILGVGVISSEYSWGTIRLILPRAGSRAALLTAKILLLLLFVAAVVVTGYLGALVSSFIASTIEDVGTNLGGDVIPQTLASLVRTGYVMLPYLALAFFVAVLTRSTAAGIAIGLSVFFVEGIVTNAIGALPDPFDDIPKLLLSENVSAVMSANAVEGSLNQPNPDLPGPWQGAGVLAAYVAVLVALSYQRFITRDVTTG
jgi:ABC-2 type transport system permease protein